MKQIETCVNMLNTKTIILLNLVECRLILAALVSGVIPRDFAGQLFKIQCPNGFNSTARFFGREQNKPRFSFIHN